MFSLKSACLSVYPPDYSKSYERILYCTLITILVQGIFALGINAVIITVTAQYSYGL